MALRSSEATINFLLSCIDNTEGKTDWNAVATKSGWYKAGKFSKQAFDRIQKKYANTEVGKTAEEAEAAKGEDSEKKKPAPKKPTTPQKRAAEDGGDRKGAAKKPRKGDRAEEVKGKEEYEDADDEDEE